MHCLQLKSHHMIPSHLHLHLKSWNSTPIKPYHESLTIHASNMLLYILKFGYTHAHVIIITV